MGEWQPIETADRGPTRKAILAWVPTLKSMYAIVWDKHDEQWCYYGSHSALSFCPTHWMPLPAPPDDP